MISLEKLSQLINSHESSILDFKSRMYDFDNDENGKRIGSYVKDVIAFTNTIRTESSFILVGIEEKVSSENIVVGIDEIIDEGILQDKIKDKVYPLPNFSFHTAKIEGKIIGIFEFPVFKFSQPVVSTVKLKGVEVGQIYHRKGSTNSLATSLESIYISDWLKGLNHIGTNSFSIKDNVSAYIKRISSKNEPLSSIISELYEKSKKEGLLTIENFCKNELLGFQDFKGEQFVAKTNNQFKHRVLEIFWSMYKIESGHYVNEALLKREFDNSDKIHNAEIIFNFPLFQIENYLEKFKDSKTGVFIQTVDFYDIFPNKPENKGVPIYRYILPESFNHLYNQISQKLIEILLNL